MATYFTRQRMREVAVRKTFGAQNGEVLRMLIMSFMKLVAIAFVIAVPVIWYTMHDWLSQYAYRIGLSWWIFAGAGLLASLIAGAKVFRPIIQSNSHFTGPDTQEAIKIGTNRPAKVVKVPTDFAGYINCYLYYVKYTY